MVLSLLASFIAFLFITRKQRVWVLYDIYFLVRASLWINIRALICLSVVHRYFYHFSSQLALYVSVMDFFITETVFCWLCKLVTERNIEIYLRILPLSGDSFFPSAWACLEKSIIYINEKGEALKTCIECCPFFCV